jgi:hypothetical protein
MSQWVAMFGSHDVDIASDLPRWVAQDDWDPNLSDVAPLIGGWTFATGKQYNISVAGSTDAADPCMGVVDLDSFAASVESTTSIASTSSTPKLATTKISTIKTSIIIASTSKTSTLTPSPTSTSGLGSCVCDL